MTMAANIRRPSSSAGSLALALKSLNTSGQPFQFRHGSGDRNPAAHAERAQVAELGEKVFHCVSYVPAAPQRRQGDAPLRSESRRNVNRRIG